MENTAIRIRESRKDILPKLLVVDVGYLNKLNWKLLFIEGTYKDVEMLPFENYVNNSEYGVAISFSEVINIPTRINDLWNLLLLGQIGKSNLVRKDDEDKVIFDSSDLVIEYFDSSYWTISSNNADFIERIKIDVAKEYESYI